MDGWRSHAVSRTLSLPDFRQRALSLRPLTYCILSGFACFAAVILLLTHISVSFSGMPARVPIMIVSSLLCAYLYRSREGGWITRLICGLECVSLLALISLVGGVASYPLAALSWGWLDDRLVAADSVLGLNWLSYWNFVNSHQVLKSVWEYAYFSIFPTPVILLILLNASGKSEAAYRFLIAYAVALIITDLTFVFVPAKAAVEHFLPAGTPGITASASMHISIIEQLRTGTFHKIALGGLGALITFPSFHAASACLFAWAGWGLRWVRVPCLALNLAMLLATPIVGGHYFIDLLGGMVVAATGIVIASNLPGQRPKGDQAPSTSRSGHGAETGLRIPA